MLVLEVHIVLLLHQLYHLAESVHVQLADEGGQTTVTEEVAQHLLLQLLRVLYEDLGVTVPGEVIAELSFLGEGGST